MWEDPIVKEVRQARLEIDTSAAEIFAIFMSEH